MCKTELSTLPVQSNAANSDAEGHQELSSNQMQFQDPLSTGLVDVLYHNSKASSVLRDPALTEIWVQQVVCVMRSHIYLNKI